jgi:hypothetical protein
MPICAGWVSTSLTISSAWCHCQQQSVSGAAVGLWVHNVYRNPITLQYYCVQVLGRRYCLLCCLIHMPRQPFKGSKQYCCKDILPNDEAYAAHALPVLFSAYGWGQLLRPSIPCPSGRHNRIQSTMSVDATVRGSPLVPHRASQPGLESDGATACCSRHLLVDATHPLECRLLEVESQPALFRIWLGAQLALSDDALPHVGLFAIGRGAGLCSFMVVPLHGSACWCTGVCVRVGHGGRGMSRELWCMWSSWQIITSHMLFQ